MNILRRTTEEQRLLIIRTAERPLISDGYTVRLRHTVSGKDVTLSDLREEGGAREYYRFRVALPDTADLGEYELTLCLYSMVLERGLLMIVPEGMPDGPAEYDTEYNVCVYEQ